MLRDFGVKGVKVQEVVSLDDEMLMFLQYVINLLISELPVTILAMTNAGCSKPVYGLIFLFRWKEDDAYKQEQSCPEGLWFANQVSRLHHCSAIINTNF